MHFLQLTLTIYSLNSQWIYEGGGGATSSSVICCLSVCLSNFCSLYRKKLVVGKSAQKSSTFAPKKLPSLHHQHFLAVSEACRSELADGACNAGGCWGVNSAWKGLAPWRGQCQLRAGVPPLRPQHRLGAAPPNKKGKSWKIPNPVSSGY